jgi:TonB-linked SusC/RagA family outer membrane protein
MKKQNLTSVYRWWLFILPVCLFLCSATGYTQNNMKVSGTVVDDKGEPLIGVSIIVKGTASIGTITDVDGKFSLSDLSSKAVLVVSYVGFATQDVPVNGRSQLNIKLIEDLKALNEVVVVGYGTMRKKDLTGAVTQIIPDKIATENPKTVQDVLRGTAGVSISYDPSGKGGGNFQIRGQRSVYGPDKDNHDRSFDPLIVLDGMMFMGELSEINPDDIGQIDILKDASAAAIYGAQAANGVIIITTKKGQQGKAKVNVSANYGVVQRSAYRAVFNADEYIQHRTDWYKRNTYGINPATGAYEAYQAVDSKGVLVKPTGYYENPNNLTKYGITIDQWRAYDNASDQSDAGIFADRIYLAYTPKANYIAGKTFDWYDHTFRTGIQQDYNGSVSGANDRMNYYLSFGYLNSQGAVVYDDYKSFRSNMKVEGQVTNWLNIGANVNFQNRSDNPYDYNWCMSPNLGLNSGDANVNQIRNSPFASYEDDNGLVQYPNGATAPASWRGMNFDVRRQYQKQDAGYTILNTILSAKVKLPFGISYSFNAAPRYQWYHNYFWASSQNPDWVSTNGYVKRQNDWNFEWSLNNQLHWDQTFNSVHKVDLTLVQEAERHQTFSDIINARNFIPSDALGYHNTANSTLASSDYTTKDTQQSADALLARLFYSYSDRYMLTTSVRRDGYSAFGTSNPYAVFPSLGVAWTFTNEKFFKYEPVNYGKLRISWGKNGNRGLQDPYVALANLTGSSGQGYVNSSGQLTNFQYLRIERMPNPNLKWETSTAWNLGLDFGLLNNRIAGTLEYYSIATHNMIMQQSLVNVTGFNNVYTNLGEVSNKGFEFTINSSNLKTPEFEWNTSFNLAYNQNKIIHLYYEYQDMLDASGNVIGKKEKDDPTNNWFIGKPISEVWDYKVAGIWQVNEMDEAAKYGQRPGDPKVKNNPANDTQNADGSTKIVWNNDDREFLGQRTPPLNLSMRNDFTLFKNWTVSVNMYARTGFIKTSNLFMNDDNSSNNVDQTFNVWKKPYWTPENPSSKYGRLQAQGPTGGPTLPIKVFNCSFLRLDNISLSYSLPQKWTSRLQIDRVRISGAIRNVAVWTKDWPYGDPETSNDGGLATRVFSLGLNVVL